MALLPQVGERVAEMDACLMSFSHAATDRTHTWDLRSVLSVRDFLSSVDNAERKALAAAVFDAYAWLASAPAWLRMF